MYYMREFGLHNPLVREASSDQDKPGVCVEMELSAPVLCWCVTKTLQREQVMVRLQSEYLTSSFESSEVNNNQTLLVLKVNSCELQHNPHSLCLKGKQLFSKSTNITVSHVTHRNLVTSFQSIFWFFSLPTLCPSFTLPVHFSITCCIQHCPERSVN